MTNPEGGVLVADGHRLVRGGMMSIVSAELAMTDVTGADDFDGVMAAMAQHPQIRLLLLDSELPGMGGIQGLRKIRLQRPDVLVVVLVWHEQRAEAFEALAAGAHGYLPKDRPPGEIVEALRLVMSGQIYVPSIISDLSFCEQDTPADWEGRDRADLTVRQREVLTHLAAGLSNKEIARALKIAEGTVKVHITAAFRSLHVHNRVGAAAALLKLQSSNGGRQPDLPGISEGAGPDRRKKDRGYQFALTCLPMAAHQLWLTDAGLVALVG